ncbi:MAG: helix-turn-helix transcriptional regulator [Pseudomonadaceae bacterium]|nr:helix-turn-helix transcriptional regulator [Pseudomonadaceae bacterium]
MIRFRLKELIADKEFKENRRITIDEIATSTGINRSTISKIANHRGYNATTDVLAKLCKYFSVPLNELAELVDTDSVNENL